MPATTLWKTLLGLALTVGLAAGCSGGGASAPAGAASGPPMPSYAALPTRSMAPSTYGVASGAGASDPTTQAVDLPTVMRLAAGRNLDVQIVRERLRESHAQMVHAGWWMLPTIRPGVRFNSVDGNVQSTEGAIVDVNKRNAFAGAGVYVDWEIGDALFDQLAAWQRAGASRHAADAGLNDATLAAAEAYLDLLRAQTALAIADEAAELYDNLLAETEARVAAGGGFRGDVLRARAKRSHAAVDQSRATRQQRDAALRLREILDLPSTVELYASEGAPVKLELVDANQSEDELLRQALLGRPEVRQAEFDSKAALAERNRTTVGPWIPRVTAGWEGGGFGRDFDSLGGSSDVGVGVSWEVGRDGIGGKARQAAAAARERESRIRIQQVRQHVIRQVASARNQAVSQDEAMQAAERGVADAKEALELYRKRQQVGVGIPLDAIVAQETYAEAQLDYLDAVIGYDKAQMRLLHSVGAIGR
ncbi:MAG: TolC family protein [Planctomycetota bacterium]|nr:TolC family protein [Planctomycetota bacterium]